MTETSAQTRKSTPEEDIRELYSRTAKLNDAVSALLAPEWGSAAGIIPPDHPLYVSAKPVAEQQEQGAPVDWQAIAKQRERELKKFGEARHRAEQQRDEARQWARHGYEIGQRHCSWSDHGVAPAWLTEGWPRSFDSREHLQQAAEFDEALTRVRMVVNTHRAHLQLTDPTLLAKLDRALQPSAHDGGPSVAEAAADDRTWPLEKAGE